MNQTIRTEITLRLEGDLLQAIDSVVEKVGFSSRNEAIENILQRWHRSLIQHKLDRETEAYYKSLTPEEIDEDRAWVEFPAKHAIDRKSYYACSWCYCV